MCSLATALRKTLWAFANQLMQCSKGTVRCTLNSGPELQCASAFMQERKATVHLPSGQYKTVVLTAPIHLSNYITQNARPLSHWVSSQSGQPASLSGKLWLDPFSLQRRAPGEGPPSRCALLSTPTHVPRTLLINTGPPTIPVWGNEHQIPKADGHFV
jgi:hypothetical protein